MDRMELVELLSPEGLRLLDSLPPFDPSADVVRTVSELRKAGHSPGLVAAVLSQSRLRAKAELKFGDFRSRMLFTDAGLEQATRLRVAALHAGRFVAAGITTVADLGCGIGGDAMAMAAMDLAVTAVDADEVTATVASFNLAPFPTAHVLQADAETFDLTGFEGAWFDPARRTSGHSNTSRLTKPEDYSPSLDYVFGLARTLPIGVKLGPGHDRSLIPAEAEAQWVSVDGQLVEMGLWFGPLARDGIRRSALLLRVDGVSELTAPADSDDVPAGALGEYLYEPDGAVIRARLIGDLARTLGGRMLSDGIAYITADSAVDTPFATAFRVLDVLPADEKKLRQAIQERKIGTLEIKKRGVDVDPAALRVRLRLKGPESATIVVTRVGGHRVTLLVERIR
jgi:SAM-dependent methyltransferase